jgi:hypothetical protein
MLIFILSLPIGKIWHNDNINYSSNGRNYKFIIEHNKLI